MRSKELPGLQPQPGQTTAAAVARAQRRWIRRFLGIQVPRRRTAGAAPRGRPHHDEGTGVATSSAAKVRPFPAAGPQFRLTRSGSITGRCRGSTSTSSLPIAGGAGA